MRLPNERETLELMLKEPHAFGIVAETEEGRRQYRRVEAKLRRLFGKEIREEYEKTHTPILALPQQEIEWLEKTGRIVVLKRNECHSWTYRNGKEVSCLEVEVVSWQQVYKAYRMTWAKFGLAKYRT